MRRGQQPVEPVGQVGGPSQHPQLDRVGQPFVEPLDGRGGESRGGSPGEAGEVGRLVQEDGGEPPGGELLAVEVDDVGVIGAWGREGGVEVCGTDKRPQGGGASLPLFEEGREQHGEPAVSIDIGDGSQAVVDRGQHLRFEQRGEFGEPEPFVRHGCIGRGLIHIEADEAGVKRQAGLNRECVGASRRAADRDPEPPVTGEAVLVGLGGGGGRPGDIGGCGRLGAGER